MYILLEKKSWNCDECSPRGTVWWDSWMDHWGCILSPCPQGHWDPQWKYPTFSQWLTLVSPATSSWVSLLIEQGPLRKQNLLSSGYTADLQGLALRLHRVPGWASVCRANAMLPPFCLSPHLFLGLTLTQLGSGSSAHVFLRSFFFFVIQRGL